jgi:hypothetical protein
MRAVCVLSMALVCAMGVAQAVHAHPDDSSTSHHACSICSAAHAGVSLAPAATTPVMAATALAAPAAEFSAIARPATAHFIRPPPSGSPAF